MESSTAINNTENSTRNIDNDESKAFQNPNIVEFKIDLSDAVFKGSEESYDKIVSMYQMRLNLTNYEADAYQACLDDKYSSDMVPRNTRCSRTVRSVSTRKASNIMRQWARTTKNGRLKEELLDAASRITDDISETEEAALLHEFFSKFTAQGLETLDDTAEKYRDQMIEDFETYLKRKFEPRLKKLF